MRTYPLIGGGIFAVVLLVLGSLANVVGFETVQSSNQKVINDAIDQKELLFQIILDMANNKEIQKIILNSEIRREGFFNPDIRFFKFTPQVLTKASINHLYLVGLMLSKTICKSKMHSIIEYYQVSHQEIQNVINAVIEKDTILDREITQLSGLKCDCGNENTSWNFPILCTLLAPILYFDLFMQAVGFLIFHLNDLPFLFFLARIMGIIGSTLNCNWINY